MIKDINGEGPMILKIRIKELAQLALKVPMAMDLMEKGKGPNHHYMSPLLWV